VPVQGLGSRIVNQAFKSRVSSGGELSAGSQCTVLSLAYLAGIMNPHSISCSVSSVISLKVSASLTLCATPTHCAACCFVDGNFLSLLR